MERFRKIFILAIILFITSNSLYAEGRGITNTSGSPYVKLRSVDINDVKWTEGFWAKWFGQCSDVMIPNMWRILEDPEVSHAFTNFLVAGGLEKGEFNGTWWHDGDFYKWVEAAAYVYSMTKDKKLDELMDKVIDVIGKAQRENGYIHTSIIIGHGLITMRAMGRHFEGKTQPFRNLSDHELYNMGHLMTAACIHNRATGKTNFLEIAKKVGDHLYDVFGSRDKKLAHFGFNPSNIMGLVELYRSTGNKKYLELAGIFIDMRGSAPGGTDLNQTRTPLRKEHEAVGHAVTANYLYCGAADVYSETGEKELYKALKRIWDNVVFQKMYITGAVGALPNGISSAKDKVHEAYGREYQLPNINAYNETCANIANAMWNYRLLSITGDARFADIMELVIYNSALSGISLDGKHFFYRNVLRRVSSKKDISMWDLVARQPYIACFCCPSNIVRTIAKLHGWTYSISDKGVWINLYGGNELNTELADGSKLKLIQETDYPWDGRIKITIEIPEKKNFSIMLRIPGWADDAELKINGSDIDPDILPGEYLEINRTWLSGDVIELNIPMEAKLITANPLIEETRNQVAVKRGPVVYCLESPDLPENIKVSEIIIPRDIELKSRYDDYFLRGINILEGKAYILKEGNRSNNLYGKISNNKKQSIGIKLIPYYAWNNRGVSYMTVWMPVSISVSIHRQALY